MVKIGKRSFLLLMDKNYFIQLTKNLYAITLLFPKKEPLRYKMRELASEIMLSPKNADLEILDSFFEVAKAQNWVPLQQVLAIQQEYDNLRKGLKVILSQEKAQGADFQPSSSKVLLGRQEKLLSILKEKGRAQVWEMKKIFPEVSKRTLRRDFEFLLKQGTIERIGERNTTFYQIKLA